MKRFIRPLIGLGLLIIGLPVVLLLVAGLYVVAVMIVITEK